MQFDKDNYINSVLTNLKRKKIDNTEWKNTLVIGDIHFGIKNGSSLWLNAQKQLFRQQIFPLIERANELNISDVVILGDMFDVRSSTNTFVAVSVKEIIKEMSVIASLVDVNIYIIAGNHDFYSPDQNAKEYNAYAAVFGNEFSYKYTNVHFVTLNSKSIYKVDLNNQHIGCVELLPWYETAVEEKFVDNLSIIYKINSSKKNQTEHCYGCYCHTDLISATYNPTLYKALNMVKIPFWSGHIHYITKVKNMPLHNVGACMQYNFGDADSDRYVYIINEKEQKIVAIKNTVTPKFKRICEQQLFADNVIEICSNMSFIEINIESQNVSNPKYTDRISYLRDMFPNANISIKSVFSIETNNEQKPFIYSNIENYIDDNVPDTLKPNLSVIKEHIKENR